MKSKAFPHGVEVARIRPERVSAQVAQVLSTVIRDEFSDPMLSLTTIMEVRMSKDLAVAKVLVSHVDPAVNQEEVLLALKRHARRLRWRLAHSVRLRTVPRLVFIWDSRAAEVERVHQLIDKGLRASTKVDS